MILECHNKPQLFSYKPTHELVSFPDPLVSSKTAFFTLLDQYNMELATGIQTGFVMRYLRPSLSAFGYCNQSKTGGGKGLGTRLGVHTAYPPDFQSIAQCL